MKTREQKPIYWLNHKDDDTPEDIKKALLKAYHESTKIRLHYGDAKTGVSWMEENDIVGRLGRSTGSQPVMILLAHDLSTGGAILPHCIVAIQAYETGKFLYKHSTFKVPSLYVKEAGTKEEKYYEVRFVEGDALQATFNSEKKAQAYTKFICGATNKRTYLTPDFT